jgi:hypothetical protein
MKKKIIIGIIAVSVLGFIAYFFLLKKKHPYEGKLISGLGSTGSGATIFLVQDGKKKPFRSKESFLSRGFKFENVLDDLSQNILDSIPLGQAI